MNYPPKRKRGTGEREFEEFECRKSQLTAGIISYSAYITITAVRWDAVAEAWESGSIRGEGSVAKNNEDTITVSI